jgi:ribosomal protein S18 acetylase RimI-like enzyme
VKVRRHDGGLGPRVRVRPWAFDHGVVQLALADQAIVPSVDEVRTWADTLAGQLRPDGATVRTIRTGALFPEAASRFADAGFRVIDTLALLRIDLAEHPRSDRIPTVALRARRHREAAQIDRAAFGDPWGNDARDLAEIRRATPVHRARARTARRGAGWRQPIVGFAITGAASGQGYLQRLAVLPAEQGHGHGRALVVDSLAWMWARRLRHGVVNTAVDNARALGLYESLGFRRLPDELLVMQLDAATDR